MTWQPIETAPKSDSFKDAIRILVFIFVITSLNNLTNSSSLKTKIDSSILK